MRRTRRPDRLIALALAATLSGSAVPLAAQTETSPIPVSTAPAAVPPSWRGSTSSWLIWQTG